MSGSAKIMKVLWFGFLGALGCVAGWLIGELFLRAFLPTPEVAGGSLASKPELPALESKASLSAPPVASLPAVEEFKRAQAPTAPVPTPLAGTSRTPSTPPASQPAPTLAIVGTKAAPVAPPPPEFAQRLEKVGAKTGDVQISLIWFNVNDLDLYCIEPNGNRIFYNNRRSASGGELDVDMNVTPTTDRPVENIYWPKGKAPLGKYLIYVDHYANNGGRDPSEYKVSLLIGGTRKEFTGKISRGQPRALVAEFNVKPGDLGGKADVPEIRLAASPELVVYQGGKNQLQVRLARANFNGPVTVRLEGDVSGLSPQEFLIPASQNELTATISADASAGARERLLTLRASGGGLTTEAKFKLVVRAIEPELRIAASPELVLFPGGTNQFKVRIARANLTGPVVCRLRGDLSGLTAPDVTIGAGDTEAEIELFAAPTASVGVRPVRIEASAGAVKAEASMRLDVKQIPSALRIAVSPELIVHPGGVNRLLIRVARSNLAVPVSVRLEGDLQGVSPREFVLNATADELTAEIGVDAKATLGERLVTVNASAGSVQAGAQFRLKIERSAPALRVALPGEIRINQDGSNTLPVRIARANFEGPVTIRLEGETDGVKPLEFTVPADRDATEVELKTTGAAGKRALQVKAIGANVRAETKLDLVVLSPAGAEGPPWSWQLILVIGLWTALLATGLSFALAMGQNKYLTRPLLSPSEAALLLAGGLTAGVVAGGLGQTLYSLLTLFRMVPEWGFLAGWLLLGGLLGRGVCYFVPNLSGWRATAAGCVGGLLGAAAFLAVSAVGDVAGRFMGAAILGCAIGLMVALVEMAYRKVWLEVVYGPREVRSVNLGATPVIIGGDGAKCTVWVQGAPGKALKFWEQDGQVFCLDIVAEKTRVVVPGYRHPLKKAEVVVCSSSTGAQPAARVAPIPAVGIPVARPAVAPPRQAPTAPPRQAPAAPPRQTPAAATPRQAPAPAPFRKPVDPNACPTCAKTAPGSPGKRYCILCDRLF